MGGDFDFDGDGSGIFVIFNGAMSGPFGVSYLPPGGLPLSFPAPAGFAGSSLLVQGLVLAGKPSNPLFTTTEAQEIVF